MADNTPKFSKPAIITACLSGAFLVASLLFANPYMPTYLFTEKFVVADPPMALASDPTAVLALKGDAVITSGQQVLIAQQASEEASLSMLYANPQPVIPASSVTSPAASKSTASKSTATKSKSSQLSKNQLLQLPISKLSTINKDFLGKLYVEGSSISEIVVVGETNTTYLRSDFYHNYAYYGTIFGDSRTSKTTLDRNTILMGHNTGKSKPNDHAFGKLRYYRTTGYAKDHPTITFQTVHGDYKFQIFSVFVTPGPVTASNYPNHFMRMEFKDDAEFEAYLKKMKAASLYDTGVSISGSDKILTLVCCVYDYEDARLVIMAKKVD